MHFEVENIEGVRVVMFRVLELNHSNSAAIKKSLAATVDFEQPAVIIWIVWSTSILPGSA